MVTPQINIRVPAELHPLIKRIGELLRLRPDLGGQIAAQVEALEAIALADRAGDDSRPSSSPEAGGMGLEPPGTVARLEALEGTVGALERRLEALEAGRPATVPPEPPPPPPAPRQPKGLDKLRRRAGVRIK